MIIFDPVQDLYTGGKDEPRIPAVGPQLTLDDLSNEFLGIDSVNPRMSTIASPDVQSVPTTESNITQAEVLAGLGVAITMIGQIWYIKQIRDGNAAKSGVSMGLNAVNDGLLAGSAIATGQGIASSAVMATYALMDVISTAEIFRKDGGIKVKASDWVCMAGSIIGWCALLNLAPKIATEGMDEKQLNFAASVIASSVNLVIMAPLIRDACFGAIDQSEIIPKPTSFKGWLAKTLQPTIPWLFDMSAYTLVLATAPKGTLEQWLQPAAVFAVGLISVAATAVWGHRRQQ